MSNYPDDVSPASFSRYWNDKLSDPPEDDDIEDGNERYWRRMDAAMELFKEDF